MHENIAAKSNRFLFYVPPLLWEWLKEEVAIMRKSIFVDHIDKF